MYMYIVRRASSSVVRRQTASIVVRRGRIMKLYKGSAFQKKLPFSQGGSKTIKSNNDDKHDHGQERGDPQHCQGDKESGVCTY